MLDTLNALFDNAPMDEGLVIEGISFQGHCGVTVEERAIPQPLLVDLEFACSAMDAIRTDSLSKTIDYAQVAARVIDMGRTEKCALLETMADRMSRVLLAEFPMQTLRIWLRKAKPPLEHVMGTVGVRLTYTRSQGTHAIESPPPPISPFLVTHCHNIPRGKVLDLACGSGRHALYLAGKGYEVVGIDRNPEALAALSQAARTHHLSNITVRELDLEVDETHPPSLGVNAFDGIMVSYYLYRPIFPSMITALKPGGILIYETFLIDNHHQFQHPRRKEFCLEHNELFHLIRGLRVLHYEEGQHQDHLGQQAVFTARLVAQKL